MQETKIIGISGGSGSGKTTFVNRVRAESAGVDVLVLQLDHYYHDLSHIAPEARDRKNFDHPDSIDSNLLMTQLAELAKGRPVFRPTYDFATHTRFTLFFTRENNLGKSLNDLLEIDFEFF